MRAIPAIGAVTQPVSGETAMLPSASLSQASSIVPSHFPTSR